MDRRTKTTIAAALWIGFFVMGTAIVAQTAAGPRTVEGPAQEDVGLRERRTRQDRQGIHQRGRPVGGGQGRGQPVLAPEGQERRRHLQRRSGRGHELQGLDLSVRLKAVAGEIDRGGGLVWRAKDEKNYYIAATTRLRTTSASTRSRTASAPMFKNAENRPATRSGTPSG